MKQLQDAYIVAATRTPVGRSGRGMFRHMRPDDLLVAAIQGALKQAPTLDVKAIEDAVIGCAMPEGEQGLNVARLGVLLAGLPNTVGGVTINRFCASGLTGIQMAADRIRVGEADVMIAGGVESMSMVSMSGNRPSFNPAVFMRDENLGIAYGMGLTAERVAEQWKVTREAQDEFALQSHLKALKAIAAGEFSDEITPVEVTERAPNLQTGAATATTRMVATDEGPRADTTLEALAKLRPVFAAKGSVTAGNSSQTSDGAACLILASDKAIKAHGLTPLARFVSFANRGVPPEIMGIGPIEAIPAALRQAGLQLGDLGWIELNEAFAAQALAVLGTLKLDPARVNPLGGAIALGHPLGATGAIRAATVVHALRRHNLKHGMVTMCVGTGQGAAGIFERV
ncbi:MAG: acetyl-CoA C-acyltransferase [Burkholderiaceae bacterium]|nr:acetyl-CoA C-acyltransferase [Burkholderiaceae bacterium]MBY0468913.1 acetyl-CoA C-acyltransferase [Burkholderiaceae bacterium]